MRRRRSGERPSGKVLWYKESSSNQGGHDAHTQIRVRFITRVATLAYLGLAILGWGGFAAFFSHPARIALAIRLFVLSCLAPFSGGNLSPGDREERANRWVLVPFALIGLLAAYLPAYADRMGFWTFDGDAIRWLGVVLFAAGSVLRIWPVFVLGHRFSGLIAIQPGHTLVTSGVYRVIRHPSYLGLLVNSLGWGLAFRSGSACGLRRSSSRHSSRASAPKRGCYAPTSAPSTRITAPGHHG